jgi:hypothetical protein
VYDGPSAKKWLDHPAGAAALQAALKSAAGDSWAAKIRRDSEHSASASAILHAAAQMGLDVSVPAQSIIGNRAITNLLSLPSDRRYRIRQTIWAALKSGVSGEPLDALALKLLGFEEEQEQQ